MNLIEQLTRLVKTGQKKSDYVVREPERPEKIVFWGKNGFAEFEFLKSEEWMVRWTGNALVEFVNKSAEKLGFDSLSVVFLNTMSEFGECFRTKREVGKFIENVWKAGDWEGTHSEAKNDNHFLKGKISCQKFGELFRALHETEYSARDFFEFHKLMSRLENEFFGLGLAPLGNDYLWLKALDAKALQELVESINEPALPSDEKTYTLNLNGKQVNVSGSVDSFGIGGDVPAMANFLSKHFNINKWRVNYLLSREDECFDSDKFIHLEMDEVNEVLEFIKSFNEECDRLGKWQGSELRVSYLPPKKLSMFFGIYAKIRQTYLKNRKTKIAEVVDFGLQMEGSDLFEFKWQDWAEEQEDGDSERKKALLYLKHASPHEFIKLLKEQEARQASSPT